ncbi:MAG: hypothetical protein HY541_00430 [Deltaproteobacteria bacterium]|nr:hypothetical protein [Deltaproteobacteria bacterium]
MTEKITTIKEDVGMTWKVVDKNDNGVIDGKDRIIKSPLDGASTEYKPDNTDLLKELKLPEHYTSLKGIAVADLDKYFEAMGYEGPTLPKRIEEVKALSFGSQAKLGEVHVVNPIDPKKSYYKGSALEISVAVTDVKEGEDIYATISFGGVAIKENVKIGTRPAGGTNNATLTVPVFAANEAGVFCRDGLNKAEATDKFTVILVDKNADGTFSPRADQAGQSAESVRLKKASGNTPVPTEPARPRINPPAPSSPAPSPAAPAAPAPAPASGSTNPLDD